MVELPTRAQDARTIRSEQPPGGALGTALEEANWLKAATVDRAKARLQLREARKEAADYRPNSAVLALGTGILDTVADFVDYRATENAFGAQHKGERREKHERIVAEIAARKGAKESGKAQVEASTKYLKEYNPDLKVQLRSEDNWLKKLINAGGDTVDSVRVKYDAAMAARDASTENNRNSRAERYAGWADKLRGWSAKLQQLDTEAIAQRTGDLATNIDTTSSNAQDQSEALAKTRDRLKAAIHQNIPEGFGGKADIAAMPTDAPEAMVERVAQSTDVQTENLQAVTK